MKPFRTCAALAASVAGLALPAAALTIDNFEEGDFSVSDDASVGGATLGEQSGLSTGNVIGGVRLVSVQANGSTPLPLIGAQAQLVTSPADDGAALARLGLVNDTGTFRFIYDGIADGAGNGNFGALNLNLGNPLFTGLAVASTGPVGVSTAQISLFSSGPSSNSAVVPLVENGITTFDMSGFTGVDLGNIKAIRLVIDGVALGNAPVITTFFVVPEPGTAALLGLGLAGLAGARRRKAA